MTSKTEGDVTPAKKSKTKFSSQQGFKPKVMCYVCHSKFLLISASQLIAS